MRATLCVIAVVTGALVGVDEPAGAGSADTPNMVGARPAPR